MRSTIRVRIGSAILSDEMGKSVRLLLPANYLVSHVLGCMHCHAEHEWASRDAVLPNTLGAGQDINMLKGLPGRVYAPNITPHPETGAGNWTDDQLARAIREGVGHDGRASFPFMPNPDFRSMSDEDLASVIVYLRAVAPVRKQRPTTELIFLDFGGGSIREDGGGLDKFAAVFLRRKR